MCRLVDHDILGKTGVDSFLPTARKVPKNKTFCIRDAIQLIVERGDGLPVHRTEFHLAVFCQMRESHVVATGADPKL